MKITTESDIDKRVWVAVPAVPAIIIGIFADTLIFNRVFHCEKYYCTAAAMLSLYMMLAVDWIKDWFAEKRLKARAEKRRIAMVMSLELGGSIYAPLYPY